MQGIICADLHIRGDLPRCRIDEDWDESQRLIIAEIVSIANKYDVSLFIDGDLFDTSSVPNRLISMLINEFSKINNTVHFIAGNHDLPYHSMNNVVTSSIGVLMNVSKKHKKIKSGMGLYGMWSHFNYTFYGENKEIVFIHKLVFDSIKSIPPNCEGITASDLLKEFPDAKWIFTGDNHKAFHYEKNDRHVINPGCIMRQSADEKEYKPSVFFIDTDKNIVKRIYLNDHAELVDDSYIKTENEADNRIVAFVDGIKKSKKISLSIIDNINKAVELNRKNLTDDVIQKINELIEGENNED